jgi:transglutaminase-like putative cysteine protease
MRKKVLSFFLLLSIAAFCYAADNGYAVSGISAAMKINANAVIRLEEVTFTIKSLKETVRTHHYVITVLNQKGDRWAEFSEYYDDLRSIESVEGILYDPSGKVIRKIRRKDLKDYKTGSEGTFIEDGRVKVHNFYQRSYPYTIEYTVEISNRSSMFFPTWMPRPAAGIAVEKSTMKVICPVGYEFRYKAFLYNGEPDVSIEKNKRITSWAAYNLPAVSKEPYAPVWHEISTTVLLGPGDFQVNDHKGSMKTWDDFGLFIQSLKAGRDVLPENIKREVHLIADPISDVKEKVAALYQFMQRNTHYVGIQLGIGGWQPFDAKYVAANRYGDCKALVNYMFSLLKEAGIPSYYTLVFAGRDRDSRYITTEFPSQQFNHVILCVPVQQDTVWLECTSQTLPAGYLSDFTAGRSVLLVSEAGSKLVRTPDYGIRQNIQTRHIRASLEEEGSLKLQAETNYRGLLQDDIHALINNLSRDKVKEYLHEQLDFFTYDVNLFDYKEYKQANPAIDESLEISVSHYASLTGKRLFVVPNIMTRFSQRLSADSLRRYPIELGMAYCMRDSVEITVLPGYEPESLPADVDLSTPFGTYKSVTRVANGKIFYFRQMEKFGGRFSADQYQQLVKFLEAIYKADRAKLVLIRK